MISNVMMQSRATQAHGVFAMPKLGRARHVVRSEPKETSAGSDSYSVSLEASTYLLTSHIFAQLLKLPQTVRQEEALSMDIENE